METDFIVEMGEFKGPLEVLLELVEKRKLHIHDVSLADVADAFIEHMNSHSEESPFPMADSADFILIASTLLLIKSKSLLPNLELTEDEKVNIEDLEKRLELYKKYREASLSIKEIFGRTPLYFGQENKKKFIVFSPTLEITKENTLASINDVLKNVPKQEILPKITVRKVISLEETIQNLSERIQKSIKMSFKDFSGKGKADKIHVVVSFLALLELVKQGVIRASQSSHFSDIDIESESLSVPKY